MERLTRSQAYELRRLSLHVTGFHLNNTVMMGKETHDRDGFKCKIRLLKMSAYVELNCSPSSKSSYVYVGQQQ